MISTVAFIFAIPFGGLLYLLHQKYTNVYQKYLQHYSAHQFGDTPEVNDPITLELQSGKVPTWLHGVMYRIGPGRFNIQQKDGATFSIKHAFDGLPFVHRFQVDGQAQTLKYNSRMLAKGIEESIKDKSYKGLIFFGHMPTLSFTEWIYHFIARVDKMILRPKNRNNNIADGSAVGVTTTPNFPLPSAWKKDGAPVLVNKTDANVLQKIHAETLVPEKIFNYTSYDDKLQGQFSAAHHQYDPVSKEIFNFTMVFAPKPRMVVFKTSDSGKATVLADITQRHDGSPMQAPYVHSFWLTEKYVVIPESPLVYDDKGINMLLNGAVVTSMNWHKDAPSYFHIIGRNGEGLVSSIPTTSFYTFHVANAFDNIDPTTGDTMITLDSASFEDGDIIQQIYNFGAPQRKGPKAQTPASQTQLNGMAFPPTQQESFGDLKRYTLNLTQHKLMSHEILCKNLEFPRYNQEYTTKSNPKIIYGCEKLGATEKLDSTSNLIKIDTESKDITRYGQDGFDCSEPIFVPGPNLSTEDDGILLTLANNIDCCYLIIVDAKEMKELARFRIGQFIAVTFHGSYVDHEFESINVN